MLRARSISRGLTLLALVASPAYLASEASAAAPQSALGFAINRFEPSERGSEWFVLDSLDFRGKVRPAFGVVADWAIRPQQFHADEPTGTRSLALIDHQITFHVGAAFTLANRFRLAANLPIIAYQPGNALVLDQGGQKIAYDGSGGSSIGDLRFSADARLIGAYGDPATISVGVRLWLPTGSETKYTGDHEARVEPRVSMAGEIRSFVYSTSFGIAVRKRRSVEFAGYPTGTELNFGFAAGARVLDKKLVIGPELVGTTTLADATFSGRGTPLFLLIGGHYAAGDLRIGIGAGPGLSNAAGTAAFRVVGSVEWAPAFHEATPPPPPSDRDSDGVPDEKDACPDQPGVATADPKTNGCPPPLQPPADRDGDGVIDRDDACPDIPGARTDDPKTNGCPYVPEDRDKDGVPDTGDACPDTPGVKTGDPKTNGCPVPIDGDGDGIPDNEDACPTEPGPKNSDPKKNGCPAVVIVDKQIKILEQVKFKTGSAEILPESDGILSAVAKVLKDHPEIQKVTVEGHTDNVGKAAANKELSKKRAASVVTWLVKNGVEKARLSSAGAGQEKPIDTNATDEGRANNRRVEFHIDTTKDAK